VPTTFHDEVGRPQDRPVDVQLRGEVDNRVTSGGEVLDQPDVQDVALDEGAPGIRPHWVQVGQVARVGQLVEPDDLGAAKGG
jgi:hypothetical protein